VAPSSAPIVDIVFDVEGTGLPVEHALALLRALEQWLPWLPDEPSAGVHPLRGSATGYGVLLLAHRAKLVLRMPVARFPDSRALEGQELDVAGSPLRVGAGRARPLQASATLHAQRVASAVADESAFQGEVARQLGDLGVACRFITGRRRVARAGEREIGGYSVALHGLTAEESLRMQCEGMGGDRRLGWGIFVPAKAIVAAD
jgi:CRISPR-associated protein Cas6